jgi:hypothetical protein
MWFLGFSKRFNASYNIVGSHCVNVFIKNNSPKVIKVETKLDKMIVNLLKGGLED